MFDYLRDNVSWIFSGIGVTLIIAAVALVRWLLKRARNRATMAEKKTRLSPSLTALKPGNPTSTTQQELSDKAAENSGSAFPQPVDEVNRQVEKTDTRPEDSRRTSLSQLLTPAEIRKTMKEMPPLLRSEMAKHYIGVRVYWSGLFRNIRDVDLAQDTVKV
jgi:hypothetical protein